METSKMICGANQLTGFYMMASLVFNELIRASNNANLDLFSKTHVDWSFPSSFRVFVCIPYEYNWELSTSFSEKLKLFFSKLFPFKIVHASYILKYFDISRKGLNLRQNSVITSVISSTALLGSNRESF